MRLSSPQQIPLRVRQRALAQQLGTPRILYESGKISLALLIIGLCTFLIGCAIIATYNFLYNDVISWWPVWQAQVVIWVGIAWLVVGLWIILTPLISPKVHIYLCPTGLIYIRRRMHVIRWQDIEQVWKQVMLKKNMQVVSSYTIQRTDGARFVLKSDLPHVERLGGFIEREIARNLLPQVLSTYTTGTAQDFGDITVTRTGIGVKSTQKMLSWSEVESLSVDKATVSIYRKGDSWDWVTISIASVPNAGVLKGLVDRILNEAMLAKLPQMQAYNAGFSVYFGQIALNKVGININDSQETLPWSEIASIGVGESEVLIRRKDRPDQWYTLPIWMVHDAPMLKNMVDHILHEQK